MSSVTKELQMTPHPILERHQINDWFGEGLREAARHRLMNQAHRDSGREPATVASNALPFARRLAMAWRTLAGRAHPA